MLVTSFCWWLYDSDWFGMMVAESLCLRLFSLYWWFSQCMKSATNILNQSPTSQTCHQHIWSQTSVTNIDVTVLNTPSLIVWKLESDTTSGYSECNLSCSHSDASFYSNPDTDSFPTSEELSGQTKIRRFRNDSNKNIAIRFNCEKDVKLNFRIMLGSSFFGNFLSKSAKT